jgi:hypothetical protein
VVSIDTGYDAFAPRAGGQLIYVIPKLDMVAVVALCKYADWQTNILQRAFPLGASQIAVLLGAVSGGRDHPGDCLERPGEDDGAGPLALEP